MANQTANPGFDPVRGLLSLRDSVNQMVQSGLSAVGGAQSLALDIYETDQSVIVKSAPILGAQPETIDVSITGDSLTIKGETRPDETILKKSGADLQNGWLARHGELYCTEDRLVFVPRFRRPKYLGMYQHVDLALDPFPYNGGVTSADALYLGVPLVTLEGNSYLSRQGLMLLNNLGLGELVARTPVLPNACPWPS